VKILIGYNQSPYVIRTLLIVLKSSQFIQGCDMGIRSSLILKSVLIITFFTAHDSVALTYPVVDTGQITCFDDLATTTCSSTTNDVWSGQDAHYDGNQPNYDDRGDGTILDLNTGLLWQADPGAKKTYTQALADAETLTLGGYDDWRLPTIKELYSLILFSGRDVSTCMETNAVCTQLTPFLEANYFDFTYGDVDAGERIIDAQYWSATDYVSTTMINQATVFGVNFADGRIKGYPSYNLGLDQETTQFARYVRGSTAYGMNEFITQDPDTVTDQATGLTWMRDDSGQAMDWPDALQYCQQLALAGYTDWRLPNAKELHSLVDYSRSPDTTASAALDPLFTATTLINEAGITDFPYYWTATTHADSSEQGQFAVYIAFGRALGYLTTPSGTQELLDVHGAGAQRSDPKTGDPANWAEGHGPQGDVVRIRNYVRCVRGTGLQDAVMADRDSLPWQVMEIYIATLGYAPDHEGLNYWVSRIDNDPIWTPLTVAQSFFDQPLVQERYPIADDFTTLLEALYNNLFGRTIDAEGLDYWSEDIAAGRITRNALIMALIQGGWDNTLAVTDMARFGNRVQVGLAFTAEQERLGMVYSQLDENLQTTLRMLGQSILEDVTAASETRDAAIASMREQLSLLRVD
jgi:hypothetical protein